MTTPHEDRPELDDARQAVEESRRRAEQELSQARARARGWLSLAERLKRLREENGFDRLFERAFGAGGDRG